MKPIGISIISL